LWPLRYLWPFSRNLRSNVSDAQINRGWVTLGPNLRVFPLEQTRHVGVAKSEHPRLTKGEIILEEFQPMWSQSTNVSIFKPVDAHCCHMGTAVKHAVPYCIKPSFVIFDIRADRQSARMSKITNDSLTRSGTACFIAVPIWQQWASKG